MATEQEQTKRKTGAEVPTGHVGLSVGDLERSGCFYKRAFGHLDRPT